MNAKDSLNRKINIVWLNQEMAAQMLGLIHAMPLEMSQPKLTQVEQELMKLQMEDLIQELV